LLRPFQANIIANAAFAVASDQPQMQPWFRAYLVSLEWMELGLDYQPLMIPKGVM
jgi:hypothetical protein